MGIADVIVLWRRTGRVSLPEYCTEPDLAGIGGGGPRVDDVTTDWARFAASANCGGLTLGGSDEGGDVDCVDGFLAGILGTLVWGWTGSAFTEIGCPDCFNGDCTGLIMGWLGLLMTDCNLAIGCWGRWVCGTFCGCCSWEWAGATALRCKCGDFLLSEPAAMYEKTHKTE